MVGETRTCINVAGAVLFAGDQHLSLINTAEKKTADTG